MKNLDKLIADLCSWTIEKGDFHSDRQLADRVLIADGWQVIEDESFEGGIRWSTGRNPTYCTSESNRPHPINDLNAALGVIPIDYNWSLKMQDGRAYAVLWKKPKGQQAVYGLGESERPSVAILIASLKVLKRKNHREGEGE